MLLKEYAIIVTLNGNYILKDSEKLKGTEEVEQYIYAATQLDANRQYRSHIKQIKG